MMTATLGNPMAKVRSRGGAKMDIDEADLKGNMRKSGQARKAPPPMPKAPKVPPRKKKMQKLKLKEKSSSIVQLLKHQPQGMEYVTMK